MVFQGYALFPNMNVAGNVGYGLKIRGVDAASRRRRVAEMLELVELEALAERRIDQLSGGSVSAWRWPGRSPSNPACYCSTNR